MADYTYVVDRLMAADDRNKPGNLDILVPYGDVYEAMDTITALQARNARLEAALEEIERHHGNNPSDAMADMPEVDYLRYTLMSARRVARAALSDEAPDTPQDTEDKGDGK